MIRCNKCKKEAVYNVWYENCSSTPLIGFNIAYHSFCKKHTLKVLKNEPEGYPVACIKRISDG